MPKTEIGAASHDSCFKVWSDKGLAQILISDNARTNDSYGVVIRNWTEFIQAIRECENYLKTNNLRTQEEFTPQELNALFPLTVN